MKIKLLVTLTFCLLFLALSADEWTFEDFALQIPTRCGSYRCSDGTGTGGMLVGIAFAYNETGNSALYDALFETYNGGNSECGAHLPRCRTGESHAWMIIGHLDAYRVTGSKKFFNTAMQLIDTGSTDCGPKYGWKCEDGYNHGLMMLAYGYAYDITQNDTYKEYLKQFADTGAPDCGIEDEIWKCSDGHSQGALILGYLKAFEVLVDKKYRTIAKNLYDTGAFECGPTASFRCDTAQSTSWMLLAYSIGSGIFGNEDYAKQIAEEGTGDCGPKNEFYQCRSSVDQAMMILAYKKAGFDEYKDAFLQEGARDCGSQTGPRCTEGRGQGLMVYSTADVEFFDELFTCSLGGTFCNGVCVSNIDYLGENEPCHCDIECDHLICSNGHCCQGNSVWCEASKTCTLVDKKTGEGCACNEECASSLCLDNVCIEKGVVNKGDQCKITDQCESGLVCENSLCLSNKTVLEGQKCQATIECAIGSCVDNHCCPEDKNNWCGLECKASCTTPTPEPTEMPRPEPTEVPTPEATEEPTPKPTEEPTPKPTEEVIVTTPTQEPTKVVDQTKPKPTEKAATPTPTQQNLPVEYIIGGIVILGILFFVFKGKKDETGTKEIIEIKDEKKEVESKEDTIDAKKEETTKKDEEKDDKDTVEDAKEEEEEEEISDDHSKDTKEDDKKKDATVVDTPKEKDIIAQARDMMSATPLGGINLLANELKKEKNPIRKESLEKTMIAYCKDWVKSHQLSDPIKSIEMCELVLDACKEPNKEIAELAEKVCLDESEKSDFIKRVGFILQASEHVQATDDEKAIKHRKKATDLFLGSYRKEYETDASSVDMLESEITKILKKYKKQDLEQFNKQLKKIKKKLPKKE